MADLSTDVTKLTADVAAQAQVIAAVQTLVTADTSSIADLKAQVAALQSGQTPVDTSGLEAAIASLEANNTALSAVLPAPPAAS